MTYDSWKASDAYEQANQPETPHIRVARDGDEYVIRVEYADDYLVLARYATVEEAKAALVAMLA